MSKLVHTAGLMWAAACALAGLPGTAAAAPVTATAAADSTSALAEAPTLPAVPPFDASAFSERTPLPGALRGSRALNMATLAGHRGGAAVASDMQLHGVVADNQVSDASTGSNLITQGALTGAAGLPMVIQNSGNNVLIQNATVINLQLK